MARIVVIVPDDMKDRIKAFIAESPLAKRAGLTDMSDVIKAAVDKFLTNKGA